MELAERQDKDEEMAQLLQLVEEKNQLILSLQKDLAGKDATIAQFQEQGGEGETEEVRAVQKSESLSHHRRVPPLHSRF